MAEAMAPRGPDAAGVWSQGRVVLGHRRLKIIDLSEAGAQPMVDSELGLAVCWNGCIYNYKQLRRELSEHGYRFFSHSDTEVLLKAYHHWGDRFVDRVYEAVTPMVVGLQQDLGVAVREEPVAVFAQFAPQLLVVVDAAVPADGQPQFRIDHRLCARLGQVDDLQSAMAKHDAALRPDACGIRAPGCHRLGHGRDSSEITCLARETHRAGGSPHPVDPTRWGLFRNLSARERSAATQRLPAVRRFRRPA